MEMMFNFVVALLWILLFSSCGINEARMVEPGVKDDVNSHSSSSPHEVLVPEAKAFLRARRSVRVRRSWVSEWTGENEEERESHERRRENNERHNEAAQRSRCAPTCWGTWSDYGDCTSPCGDSGYQTSTRQVSPLSGCETWVARFGCQGISSRIQACNRMCYNGGTPQDGWCFCTPWYQGTCCETRFCVESGTELTVNGTCSLCPQGSYRDAPIHSRCVDCPKGLTTPGPGARSQDFCTIRVCTEHGTELSAEGGCRNCSIGSFRNASVHASCVLCPKHLKTPHHSAVSEEDCNILHCGAGYEGFGINDTCNECPVGYYKTSVGMGPCSPCQSGHTTAHTGATSPQDCFNVIAFSSAGVVGFVLLVLVVVAGCFIQKRLSERKSRAQQPNGGESYDEIDISQMYGIEDYDDGISRHKVNKSEYIYCIFSTPEKPVPTDANEILDELKKDEVWVVSFEKQNSATPESLVGSAGIPDNGEQGTSHMSAGKGEDEPGSGDN